MLMACSIESPVQSSASPNSFIKRSFSINIERQMNELVAGVLLTYIEMIDLQISSGEEEGGEGPRVGRETEWMNGGKVDVARRVVYDCIFCMRKARPICELGEKYDSMKGLRGETRELNRCVTSWSIGRGTR